MDRPSLSLVKEDKVSKTGGDDAIPTNLPAPMSRDCDDLRRGMAKIFETYFLKSIIIASSIILIVSVCTSDWIQILEKSDHTNWIGVIMVNKKVTDGIILGNKNYRIDRNLKVRAFLEDDYTTVGENVDPNDLTMAKDPSYFKSTTSNADVPTSKGSTTKPRHNMMGDYLYMTYSSYGLWYWCRYDIIVNSKSQTLSNMMQKNCFFVHQFVLDSEESLQSTSLSESLRTSFLFPVLSVLFAMVGILAYILWLKNEKDPYNVISSTLFIMSGLVLFLGLILIISKLENEITLKRNIINGMGDKITAGEGDDEEFLPEKDDLLIAIKAMDFPSTYTRAGGKVYNLGWSFKLSCLSFIMAELTGILISKGLFYNLKEGLISIGSIERIKSYRCKEDNVDVPNSGWDRILNASLEKNLCDILYARLIELLKTPVVVNRNENNNSDDNNVEFRSLFLPHESGHRAFNLVADIGCTEYIYREPTNHTDDIEDSSILFQGKNAKGLNNMKSSSPGSSTGNPEESDIKQIGTNANESINPPSYDRMAVINPSNIERNRGDLVGLSKDFNEDGTTSTSIPFTVPSAYSLAYQNYNLKDILDILSMLKKKRAARRYLMEEILFRPSWNNFYKNDIPLKVVHPNL